MNRLASLQAPYPTPFVSSMDFNETANSSPLASFSPAAPTYRRRRDKEASGVASFTPIHYERRYAYHLFIWLHGAESSERELRQLMPRVSVRNYVGVAARGLPARGHAAGRFTWEQTPAAIESAAERVANCIEFAERRYHIHRGRIFLGGQGVGGTMAMRLALQLSLPLAGALSLGGALPQGGRPLARVNQARKLPLMLMTCRESEVYPPRQVASDLRLLHAAGCHVAVREYLCGDEWYTDMFSDMNQWMMDKICPSKSPTPA